MANYPIHISDLKIYQSCKRRWDWSSALRRNLEPRVTPSFFMQGKAIHFALASYYETGEHPAPVYLRFMEGQKSKLGVMWEDQEKAWVDMVAQGEGMMLNYIDWVRSLEHPDKDWVVVDTEIEFGPLPIPSPSGRASPKIEFAGRFDGIFRRVSTGQLWLREYKTTARAPDVDWLSFDTQSTAYAFAAQQILGEPIQGVHFRFLTKKAPQKPPRIRKGTQLSRATNSPQTMSTTYQLYLEAIAELAFDEMFPDNTSAEFRRAILEQHDNAPHFQTRLEELKAEYSDTLNELLLQGFGNYFTDIFIHKTPIEIESLVEDMHTVGLEMTRDTTPIYAEPEWLKCQFCPFKRPCRAKTLGKDYERILRDEFKPREAEEVIEE